MVEPVHPFEGGELDGLEAAPWTGTTDDLGLEQADHRLGEGVVIGVPDAAHGGRDAGLAETLAVANGQVLGGLNRSSQRFMNGGCDGEAEAWFG